MVNLTKANQMFSKTHKCVDKRKHVKIWVPVEIEPRVVPDLMALK